MIAQTENRVVLRYQDEREGFRGWAVFDGTARPLAAGGFRVQPGLSEQVLVDLAAAMSLKQRLLGLAVDGAKAGIDYDPDAPGKPDAMRRFLRFLRPHLLERLSLGSDMGTGWTEIEGLARAEGIPSVKIAVARAQGIDEAEFSARIGLLDTDVGGLTLGQRRAGHAVAAAALAALAAVGTTGTPGRNPRA
ncbi:MAG: Glu/Leu/Phe/Val dehydrogenase, partial [Actinomycetota bacterium]|nr:Glu/Leu/Phe/Val dehydrogenase [Actinomycetota bacterium]